MKTEELKELLSHAAGIAREAGERIIEVKAGRFKIEIKSDGSPVSAADLAAHDIILAGIEALGTGLPVISEENYDHQGLPDSDLFWLVDPLDGTKEFIRGGNDYTVNIALVEAGRPVLGAVYAPETSISYSAASGTGAWRAAGQAPAERIEASANGSRITAVVSKSHLNRRTEQFLQRQGVDRVIQSGSSIKLCLVADGSAQIYPRLGPTSLWDTAAAAAVALEAGCRVIDLQGAPLDYSGGGGIIHAGFIVYSPGAFAGRLVLPADYEAQMDIESSLT
ncbi:MAG TPA: 3'(2'),5'-bisphosphate nucleotidase CysQ [Candidatus Glassbacteria bacterium]|nr:3'(2'),5'-bisphosphate nucleotidase CysQ [Candidatus Glassbacteria bacterium]